jgi:hypothetical protein
MKKVMLTFMLFLTFSQFLQAQWVNSGNNILNTNTGNVGIGTLGPVYKLDINKTGAGSAVNVSGQAIGTRNDTGIDFSATNGTLVNYAKIGLQVSTGSPGHETGGFTFFTINNGVIAEKMFLDGSGNLGIGTTDAKGYKLAINGSAVANALTVKMFPWADYVFKKDYRLPSLQAVKTYIDQNQHLPEMPSEQEIAKDGLNLGEMNKLLVKKVEELTLYLIENQGLIQKQQTQIDNLNEQMKALIKQ